MYRARLSISRLPLQARRVPGSWTQSRCESIVTTAGKARKSQAVHWTEAKLRKSEDYPLTVALSETIHPSLESSKNQPIKNGKKTRASMRLASIPSSVNVRTQIVSERLCDDVLAYIGHTLEKHKGCDILDINPGAGLWSQKLHAFLQPRSHILLEPRPEKFARFLDPLLNAPDSKYRLVVKDPTQHDSYAQMVAEGVFPHQTRRDANDGNAHEANNTLLVTGSLVWDPRLPGLGFDSMAKQLYNQFASALWKHEGLHSFGAVRTLFWVDYDDFRPLFSQSIVGMQKSNRMLEMTQDLNMVVAAEHKERPVGRGSLAREAQRELESMVHALRTGRKNGYELPTHRRENVHDFAEYVDEASRGTGRMSVDSIQLYLRDQDMAGKSAIGMLQTGLRNCYLFERELKEQYPELDYGRDWILDNQNRTIKLPKDHPGRKEISLFSKMRSQFSKIIRNKKDIEHVADIGEELYLTECNALETEEGPEKEALLKKVNELDEAWDYTLNKLDRTYRQLPPTELDDRLALRYGPAARLQWDRRPFEPLVMRNDEAWPQNRLSLVSAEPRPRTAEQNPEWFEWVQDFVFGVYNQPTDSIKEALDKMQHGLSDIIDSCPSLKDPKKGGRLNMHHLRVRVLTEEMITELVMAYRGWPFKAPGTDHNKYFRYRGSPQSSTGAGWS